MNTYQVVNTETGEVTLYRANSMMVAPNGMVFLKAGKEVVLATGSLSLIISKVEK